MATTINKLITKPAHNDNINNWEVPANLNYDIIDACLGGTQAISITVADVTLTNTQAQNLAFTITGAMTGARALQLPSGFGGIYVCNNQTTGGFNLTFKTTAGAGVVLPPGLSIIYCNGTTCSFANGALVIPSGSIVDFAGSSAPSGWLMCFGQSLLRTDYPALFTAIGTTFGAVDGTHFTLPDLRGRASIGLDNMGGTPAARVTAATMTPDGNTLGAVGGEQVHTLTQAELPNVSLSGTSSTPAPVVTYNSATSTAAGTFTAGAFQLNLGSTTYNAGVLPSPMPGTVTASLGGSGSAHNNMVPGIMMNRIIKT